VGIFSRLFQRDRDKGSDASEAESAVPEETTPVNGHDHEPEAAPEEKETPEDPVDRSAWLSPTPRVAGGIQIAPQRPPPIPPPPPAPPPPVAPPEIADVLEGLMREETAPAVKPGSDAQVAAALDSLWEVEDGAPDTTAGTSTAADLAAARRVFEELAVGHVAQVRDVMLELQLGDVASSWVASSRPALRSLRAMAEQMEQADLCEALDHFCAGVELAIASGKAQVGDERKEALLERYQRLIELIPQAFELDAERDRREPIIVESLLRQVEGVENVTVDKLRAVGLDRLDRLMRARADEMAVAAGIRPDVATAIVERLRAYRAATPSAVAAPDAAAEHAGLRGLLTALRRQDELFERAAKGWSDADRTAKREQRNAREQTYLAIKVVLARLGERDRINRLDKAPFRERIAELDRYLAEVARAIRPTQQGGRTDGRAHS
jgi:hypothetical protein